jgi:hypothetical protein
VPVLKPPIYFGKESNEKIKDLILETVTKKMET